VTLRARSAATLLRWIWQLPQHLLALLFFGVLRLLPGEGPARPVRYLDAWVTFMPGRAGVALGQYIFVSRHAHSGYLHGNDRLLRHEYGHTRQSLLLGWLYLPVVGVPSITQAAYCRVASRLGNHKPAARYYERFPEAWADRLAGVVRK
jgi:hypothetical protein